MWYIAIFLMLFYCAFCCRSSSKFNTNSWWQWLITGYILSEVCRGFGFFSRARNNGLELFCHLRVTFVYLFIFSLYSDITALAKERAYAHINLSEMTIHQVLLYYKFSMTRVVSRHHHLLKCLNFLLLINWQCHTFRSQIMIFCSNFKIFTVC